MDNRTKEVDELRRLADVLRHAVMVATVGGPQQKKGTPQIKKLQRGDTVIVRDPTASGPG
jgi:hypothetical protein